MTDNPTGDGITDALVARAESGIVALLALMGDNPNRQGLLDTPARVVKAYRELANRPGDPADLLARVFTDDVGDPDQMIAVGPVDFVSLCEHHLLPFTGTAWVAYVPNPDRGVVGLSKLPRLVDHFAHRPQVQERLTSQIVDALVDHLDPLGAACLITSTHACMGLRGVRKPGAAMTTSSLRGVFRTDPTARAEFLDLARPR